MNQATEERTLSQQAEAIEAAEPRAFTQEDLDRIIQKTIRAERVRADKLVAEARAEAERLAEASADARVRREAEQREQAFVEREQALARRELRAEALETLARKGLPASLADTLDYTDAEGVKSSLEGVETAFRSAVQRGIEERMRGKELPARGTSGGVDLSKLTDYEYYRTILRKA